MAKGADRGVFRRYVEVMAALPTKPPGSTAQEVSDALAGESAGINDRGPRKPNTQLERIERALGDLVELFDGVHREQTRGERTRYWIDERLRGPALTLRTDLKD